MTTYVCLYFGSNGVSAIVGAVGGYLVSLLLPQVGRSLRPHGTTSNSLDWRHLIEATLITVMVGLVAWFGVNSLQVYQIQGALAINSPTLTDPAPSGVSQFFSVRNEGGRYVAVGTYTPSDTGDTYMDAALWESLDGGYSWSRMHHDDFLQGGVPLSNGKHAHRGMYGIAEIDAGSLILGNDNAPDGVTHGQVWRLKYGADTVEAADDLALPPAYTYSGYARHGSAEVLAGYDEHSAIVWHRDGNVAWTPEIIGDAQLTSIHSIHYQDGRWIASGSTKSSDPLYSSKSSPEANLWHNDGAVWTSTDAVHWAVADGFSHRSGSQIVNDVIQIHDQWLAVGEDDSGDPSQMDAALWTSEDLTSWRRADDRELKTPGWQSITGAAVSSDKRNVIAVGTERPPRHEKNEVGEDVNNQEWRSAVWQINFAPRPGAKSLLDLLGS